MAPKPQYQRWPSRALWALEESEELSKETSKELDRAIARLEKAILYLRSNPDSSELMIAYALRSIAEAKLNQETIRRVLAEARHGKELPSKDDGT